ncbi:hypothetical protein [Streptomyces vinaceus]|uniref:hypothetical protein n=1 Tax=Streptomyces vinaceus TaxID=1960 RepID=UPI00123E49CC|nr:hypothetical protein [Streptomyces vinaceus]GHE33147.1 hypothetical protein GCM10017778_14980 [Streptomyces vinaceus]
MADRRLVCLAALALAFTGCGGGGARPPQKGTHASGAGGTGDTGDTGGTGDPEGGTRATAAATQPPAQGRVLTGADDGFAGRLTVGQTARLRLPLPEGGPEPTAEGDAVLLIRVSNVTGTGHREWELRAVHPGTTRIRIPRTPTAAPATLTLTVT